MILRSVFENSQSISELSADRSTLSSNAAASGDFSLEVPTVDPAEPKMNYGLFIIPEVNENDALCRVCLRIAGQSTHNRTQSAGTLDVHVFSLSSFVSVARHKCCDVESPIKEVCLWLLSASFSRPLLRREEAAGQGNETLFNCHSSGGFPEPRVRWLINHTAEPPQGSVRTVSLQLPHSHVYNVTSYLKVNISKALSVSCTVENVLMNESFTSTSCE